MWVITDLQRPDLESSHQAWKEISTYMSWFWFPPRVRQAGKLNLERDCLLLVKYVQEAVLKTIQYVRVCVDHLQELDSLDTEAYTLAKSAQEDVVAYKANTPRNYWFRAPKPSMIIPELEEVLTKTRPIVKGLLDDLIPADGVLQKFLIDLEGMEFAMSSTKILLADFGLDSFVMAVNAIYRRLFSKKILLERAIEDLRRTERGE